MEFDFLRSSDYHKVEANSHMPYETNLSINLANIVKTVTSTRMVTQPNGTKIEESRSPEEIQQLSQLPPACHSEFIKNDYFLNVKVIYGCCSTSQSILLPLTIIPLTEPYSYGFLEPLGYSPTQLGDFRFDLDPREHFKFEDDPKIAAKYREDHIDDPPTNDYNKDVYV